MEKQKRKHWGETLDKNLKKRVILTFGILILLVGVFYVLSFGLSYLTGMDIFEDKSEIDLFAECLDEGGIILYIMGGDSYSESQKNEFKDSVKYLKIIDCLEQPEICQGAGIEGFPAWVIDGKVNYGNKNLDQISKISECSLN